MSVAADIIWLLQQFSQTEIWAILWTFLKQKHFLKSTQLVTRSEELVATVLKIYQQSENR